MKSLAFLCTLLLAPFAARASFLMDFDATVFQDSIKSTATASHSKTIYDAGVFAPIDSKDTFYLGALYSNTSTSDSDANGVGTSFSHGDIVLGAKWYMDKDKVFSITAGYGVLATGTYQTGSSASESWRGTSTYAKITAAPALKRFLIGISIIYSAASFNEKNIAGATTSVTYSQTVLTPALNLGLNW